jgi:hypothetical protein
MVTDIPKYSQGELNFSLTRLQGKNTILRITQPMSSWLQPNVVIPTPGDHGMQRISAFSERYPLSEHPPEVRCAILREGVSA